MAAFVGLSVHGFAAVPAAYAANNTYGGRMLCQRCKKRPATANFIEIHDGKKVGYNLCDECYNEMFGSLNNSVNSDVLAGLFGQSKRKRPGVCPVCGMEYSEFERTGLLGCAACYDVFKADLMPYIERIQGKVVHVGKVGQDASTHDLTRKLSHLQEELEKALHERRYSAAESINRRIAELSKKLSGGEGDK